MKKGRHEINEEEEKRISDDWKTRFYIPENSINPYTGLQTDNYVLKLNQEQLAHILALDNRCRELINKLTDDVVTIANDIKIHIENGSKAYDAANIIGDIYWEADIDNTRLRHLMDYNIYEAVHTVGFYKDGSIRGLDRLDEDIEVQLFGNWEGWFRSLYDEEHDKGIKLTQVFKVLFDDSHIFTLDDIMNVSPEEINQHIEIAI